MERRLDSFGLVPAEISAIEKQIADLKVCSVLHEIALSIFIFIRPIKDNLNAIGHAVGQDIETKSTEHCPKYRQSTVI